MSNPAPTTTRPSPGTITLRLAGDRVSTRFSRRGALVCGALTLGVLVLLGVALSVGDYPVAPADVVRTLLGGGEGSQDFIVRTLRLPRALAAIGVGIALGISGAIFQSIIRNPLGSPDLIGFSQGAAAGAVAGIVLLGLGGSAVAGAAAGGGMVAALAVYLIAYRRGTSGYRLVLVGIGCGAMLNAIVWWLLTRADITTAHAAAVWIIGSLNATSWDAVVLLAVVLLALAPALVVGSRWLPVLDLGEDAARGVGVPVQRAQGVLIGLAVLLVAAAVAVGGPIPFVALVAPQVARRLTRGGIGLAASGLTGAVLLLASDVLAQRLLAPVSLPVGVMTGVLGGVYLTWLLSREWRIGR